MGAFDDLIPQQSSTGGTFDDLIPQEQSKGFLDTAADVTKRLAGAVTDLIPGMVDPIVGAAQLGANLVGAGEPVNKAVDQYNKWLESKGVDEGIRAAGAMLSPVPLAAASKIPVFAGAKGVLPNVAQLAKNVGVGAATGAGFGALNPVVGAGDDFTGEKLGQMGVGAAVGGVVPALGTAVVGGTKVAGSLVDAIRGRLPALQAAKAVRATLPDEAAARAVLANAPDDLTAAQALQQAGIVAPRTQALGVRAAAGDADYYAGLQAQQEAARLTALQGVTPDLSAAQAARTATTEPMYSAATAPINLVDTRPVISEIDNLLRRQGSNPELATALTKLRSGLIGPTGKPYANAERVASALDGLKSSIANKDNAFIVKQLTGLKNQLSDAIPGYSAAQQEFARLSQPVNQAQVLEQVMAELRKPGGGERVMPFLRSIGTGENALIRRAGGQPRYGGVEEILDPSQMGTVSKIAAEMDRDLATKQLAQAGKEGATKALQDVRLSARLPAFFDKWITAANKGLATTEERIGVKTLEALTEGMKTGKNLNKMLMELPAVERNKVLMSMMKFEKTSPYITGSAVGATD